MTFVTQSYIFGQLSTNDLISEGKWRGSKNYK